MLCEPLGERAVSIQELDAKFRPFAIVPQALRSSTYTMPTPQSTLTSKALARFHEEMGAEYSLFQDISSPEEVLSAAKALEPLQRSASGSPGSLFRLESILGNINDFAAIFALGSGAEPRVTGAVWGSLKILLMVNHVLNTKHKSRCDGC